MKIIKIKNFSIEISDDILEDFYKNMSDSEIVENIVDEVQHQIGIFLCFKKYEIKNIVIVENCIFYNDHDCESAECDEILDDRFLPIYLCKERRNCEYKKKKRGNK